MKKNLFFIAMLVSTFCLVSCSKEDFATSDLKNKDASVRSTSLTLTVTYKNKTTGSYSANSISIVDEVDGFRIIIDPGTIGSQFLVGVETVIVNGNTFKLIRSNGTTYVNKNYLQISDAESGINVLLNPGNINFMDSQVIVDEADGV